MSKRKTSRVASAAFAVISLLPTSTNANTNQPAIPPEPSGGQGVSGQAPSIRESLRKIRDHFVNPANHLDADKLHISIAELQRARSQLQPDDPNIANAIFNSRATYEKIKGVQSEGAFNDSEASLRDLYAVVRGTGYKGENISKNTVLLTQQIEGEIQLAEVQAKELSAIIQNATELNERRTHSVTLKFKKWEFSLNLDNALKATKEKIVVDGDTYEKWTVGQEISSQFNFMKFLQDGTFSQYKVTVDEKERQSTYFYLDGEGKEHEISKPELYQKALQHLVNEGKAIHVKSPDFEATYIIPSGLKKADIATSVPLTRRFVKLKIENSTITTDIWKQLSNATTSHEFEFEVPPNLGKKSVEFTQDFNGASLLFGGRLSYLSAKVISERTKEDPNFRLVTTKDGRSMILPTEFLNGLQ